MEFWDFIGTLAMIFGAVLAFLIALRIIEYFTNRVTVDLITFIQRASWGEVKKRWDALSGSLF